MNPNFTLRFLLFTFALVIVVSGGVVSGGVGCAAKAALTLRSVLIEAVQVVRATPRGILRTS